MILAVGAPRAISNSSPKRRKYSSTGLGRDLELAVGHASLPASKRPCSGTREWSRITAQLASVVNWLPKSASELTEHRARRVLATSVRAASNRLLILCPPSHGACAWERVRGSKAEAANACIAKELAMECTGLHR